MLILAAFKFQHTSSCTSDPLTHFHTCTASLDLKLTISGCFIDEDANTQISWTKLEQDLRCWLPGKSICYALLSLTQHMRVNKKGNLLNLELYGSRIISQIQGTAKTLVTYMYMHRYINIYIYIYI